MKLILASTSTYRKQILNKLCVPFESASPNIDETPLIGESAEELVFRLAFNKAREIGSHQSDGFVIGSDQVASFNGSILGKPLSFDKAKTQLQMVSGNSVTFVTGLCLYNAKTQKAETIVDEFNVTFRELNEEQITTYLRIEKPYDCAGSFKCEGLGIALFKELNGIDPNTLIGLPLIKLIDLLKNQGIDIFHFMKDTSSAV